jgi:hypothetical protein
MKKRMLQKIMQMMANYVIYMLENSKSDEMFNYYFEIGAKLDTYAVEFHDIYLD